MMTTENVTISELAAVRAHWQPAPGSTFARTVDALEAAAGQRDAIRARMTTLGQEAAALEAQRAGLADGGDVEGLAALIARVTALNEVRSALGRQAVALANEIGRLGRVLDGAISELRTAAATEQEAAEALARATAEHATRAEGAAQKRAQLLGHPIKAAR